MKRAVYLCIVAAALLLFVLPSTPPQARSQFDSSSASGPSVIAPGGDQMDGSLSPGSGGGENEGDADGLSGVKNREKIADRSPEARRASVFLEMWWRLMALWAR